MLLERFDQLALARMYEGQIRVNSQSNSFKTRLID